MDQYGSASALAKGKANRPIVQCLFQGISFHDTLEPPIPEMHYLDTSSHAREKHTYTVDRLHQPLRNIAVVKDGKMSPQRGTGRRNLDRLGCWEGISRRRVAETADSQSISIGGSMRCFRCR